LIGDKFELQPHFNIINVRLQMKYIIVCLSILLANFSPIYGDQKPFVFVSCSGKCGGMSLAYSFIKLGYETSHRHSIESEVASFALELSQTRPVLFVDSIRDPIARSISSYFQNLLFHTYMDVQQLIDAYEKDRVGFINFLMQDFKTKFLGMEQYQTCRQWDKFGYDVLFDSQFDHAKKYQFYQIGNLYFLNLRFDDIKDWQKIIRSLPLPFDVSNFELLSVNRAKDKFLNTMYTDFLERITFTQHEFNLTLEQTIDYLEHFYIKEEIDAFINRWRPYIKG
jgi:hypothetical protein